MADIGSTATALTYAVAQAIYPNGLTSNSASGRRTIIRRGWLRMADLSGNCGLSAGIDYITVMPLQGHTRMHDRPLDCPWRDVTLRNSNIVTAVSGTTVTLTTTDTNPLSGVVGIRYLPAYAQMQPDPTIASTAAQPGDTLADIALRIAQQIPNVRAVRNVLYCDGARDVEVKTSGAVDQVRITRRQTSEFCVTVWSGSWQGRDATGAALDNALSDERFIPNMDVTTSQLSFSNVREIDAQQQDGIYRRDYIYEVTYDTIQTQTSVSALWVVGQGRAEVAGQSALFVIGNARPNIGALSPDGQTYYIDAAGNLILRDADPYSGILLDSSGNVIEDTGGNLVGQ